MLIKLLATSSYNIQKEYPKIFEVVVKVFGTDIELIDRPYERYTKFNIEDGKFLEFLKSLCKYSTELIVDFNFDDDSCTVEIYDDYR